MGHPMHPHPSPWCWLGGSAPARPCPVRMVQAGLNALPASTVGQSRQPPMHRAIKKEKGHKGRGGEAGPSGETVNRGILFPSHCTRLLSATFTTAADTPGNTV